MYQAVPESKGKVGGYASDDPVPKASRTQRNKLKRNDFKQNEIN